MAGKKKPEEPCELGNHVLRIDGPDQKGLIYKITGVIFNNKLNIISNHEFVDPQTRHFFMRSEFTGEVNEDKLLADLRSTLPASFNVVMTHPGKKKIVVLATKEHHCLADLLIRNEFSKINATIQAVISNHDVLGPLVEKFKIPFHHVPSTGLPREAHEAQITKLLDQYKPDYLVLAKYMRILTPEFVNGAFKNHIVNIHHSFLPAFIGANPYEQAFQRGVKIIGATSHFVTANLDEGPILVQEVIEIDHTFSAEAMRQAGEDVEVLALAKALKYVLEDRVFINANKTIIFK
ncbi:MAG: formyltetrahydrofolate deformylase [Candidatus Lokiarchaeota archaeon]|nr:formyltetrahydrofolate deformylase [Candidatus Lokiarchaeota archaeon]